MKINSKIFKVLATSTVLCFVAIIIIYKYIYAVTANFSLPDMSQISLPDQFVCKGNISYMKGWVYSVNNQPTWLNNYVKDSGFENISIQWMNNEGLIELVLVNYKHPTMAKIYYELLNPERIYRDEYQNFISSSPNINPKNWKWKNKVADEESVQCGTGSEENCYKWFYRARYSEYYLYVTLDGPICSEAFEIVVKSVNEQLITYLK
jgi:hypothetical protein